MFPSVSLISFLVRRYDDLIEETNNVVTKKRRARIVDVGVGAPDPRTQAGLKRQARSMLCLDAMLAVEWLNATQRTAAYRRVLMVRRELEELGAMLNGLRQLEQAREQRIRNQKPIEEILEISRNLSPAEKIEADEAIKAKQKLRAQFRERHNAFNQLIARYTYVPVLDYSGDYGIWRFNAVSKHSREPKITVNDGYSNIRVDESTVIAALCRLAANRELFKVRLCAQCEKHWRVSEREMDRFCSQKCRDSWHAKSPDYHERKADNQREYRARLKQAIARGVSFK
jgi:hypothetical protein